MGKVVTFGEIMMRLNPRGYLRFRQADNLELSYAGAEANVAVSIANFGDKARFVTKLPDNELGRSAAESVGRFGVDTSHILFEGERLGLYFVEKGVSQRPSKVIYDRAASAISQAHPSDFNWDEIFSGASWFHFTGITPALGGYLPQICLQACKAAKNRRIKVSCDLNYRQKLWTSSQARETMSELMPYVDVCIANEADAGDVFGVRAINTDTDKGELDYKAYESVAKELTNRFDLDVCAITLRGSISASVNDWSAMLYDGESAYYTRTYRIDLVDRIGGGDSFAGALVYCLNNEYGMQDALDFAVAASCLKQTIEQDFNLSSVEEIQKLVSGEESGRVQR